MPYVTYNLCPACTTWQEGQWSPRAKVAMETTSGCSLLLFAAFTRLRAELFKISLCWACILLLYFPTLLYSFSSPSFPFLTQTVIGSGIWMCANVVHTQIPNNATSPPTHKHLSLFVLGYSDESRLFWFLVIVKSNFSLTNILHASWSNPFTYIHKTSWFIFLAS